MFMFIRVSFCLFIFFFFFSSRRRHTRYWRDWSSDVCSSDLPEREQGREVHGTQDMLAEDSDERTMQQIDAVREQSHSERDSRRKQAAHSRYPAAVHDSHQTGYPGAKHEVDHEVVVNNPN